MRLWCVCLVAIRTLDEGIVSKSQKDSEGGIVVRRQHLIICSMAALFLAAGCLVCLLLEKPKYSYSERRYLAAAPKLSAETVKSGQFMSDFEAYALDTFPFRERLRMIQTGMSAHIFQLQDQQGMYVSNGFFAKMEYPMHKDSLIQAAGQFASVCTKYLSEENAVYLSVIPDKNCFLAKESGHLSMDYEEFENIMKREAYFAEYIPISDLLEKEDYYKTDPHWRQEKITDVADRLAERMGTQLENDYKVHALAQKFYGAYYGQYALSKEADTLKYLTGEAIDQCIVYDWQNGKQITVYDMEKASGKDPYEIFLSGPLSLLTIENPKAGNQKKLVIFRDSFGSAIAPLLASGYEQITLVDIRYIRPEVLGQFVDFEGCEVLFLYSTLVLNHGV